MEQQMPPIKVPSEKDILPELEEECFVSSKFTHSDNEKDGAVSVSSIGNKQDCVKIFSNCEDYENRLHLSENDTILMKSCAHKETECPTEAHNSNGFPRSCSNNNNSQSQVIETLNLSCSDVSILPTIYLKNVDSKSSSDTKAPSETEKPHEKDVCKQQFEQLFDSKTETEVRRDDTGKCNDKDNEQFDNANSDDLKEPYSLIVLKSNGIDKFSILDCDNVNDICLSKPSGILELKQDGIRVDEKVKDIDVKTASCNDKCENRNSCEDDTEAVEKSDVFGWKEDVEYFPSNCKPYFKAPTVDNVDKTDELNFKTMKSYKADPFTLSSDEDFSPKAYKPIKRKLSQRIVDIGPGDSRLFEDLLGSDGNNCTEQKKQKLGAEEISLSGCKRRRVAYVYSKELVEKVNTLIRIEGRANLVHSLIEVYGILQHVDIIPPRFASDTEILGFHCPMYIDFLRKMTDYEDPSDPESAEAEVYGLSYDCPFQEKVFETASLISGGTIAASESLINGTAGIAINWCGGWHHAKRDSASGFCYVNDIVLGILKLREKFDRVLYVDLDLHHGDGVEEAFYMTPKVMTVSFHKYACGFFPGSGSVEDVGSGRGKLHTVNVPLLDGINDAQFFSIFTRVMKKVKEKFQGEALVIQCGADSLSEDPMASFNITHVAIAKCVCFLLTWNLPTLLLGGGGYNFPNTAKCWTFLTAMAAGKKLPLDIPEHEHLLEYGPTYELTTTQGNRKDFNTNEHLTQIVSKIYKNLNSL